MIPKDLEHLVKCNPYLFHQYPRIPNFGLFHSVISNGNFSIFPLKMLNFNLSPSLLISVFQDVPLANCHRKRLSKRFGWNPGVETESYCRRITLRSKIRIWKNCPGAQAHRMTLNWPWTLQGIPYISTGSRQSKISVRFALRLAIFKILYDGSYFK